MNALETETGIDRRTLAKRLTCVPASSIRTVGTRIERKWKLRDILPYLDAKPSEPAQSAEESAYEVLQTFVANEMFPKLIETPAFVSLLTGHLVSELGFSKGQALAVYQVAVLALGWGISEGFGDDDMQFKVPDDALIRKLGARSVAELEEFAAEHWPASRTA